MVILIKYFLEYMTIWITKGIYYVKSLIEDALLFNFRISEAQAYVVKIS